MDDQEIRNAIVAKLLHKRVVGSHEKQVTSVVQMALPSHAEGRGKALIDDLVQDGVIERYGGGHRTNVRLTSVATAVEYLQSHDGDVPFGFD